MKQSLPLAALCAFASLSNADITLKGAMTAGARLTVDGSITTGTNLTMGNDGIVWRSITACQTVSLGDRTLYTAVHATTLNKGSNVSGPALDPVSVCVAPDFNVGPFTPGTVGASVTNQGRLVLPAAARGDVSVQNQSTLILEPGLHEFKSLNVGPNCQIVFKPGSNLKVKGDFIASNTLRLTGDGAPYAALEVGGKLSVGTDAYFPMALIVGGSAAFTDRAYIRNLQAASLSLGNDCYVAGQSDIVLPTTKVFDDNFNTETSGWGYLSNQKTLTNWNIVAGTIDVDGYDDGFYGLDPAQGRMVDMTGSDASGTPGSISTKTIFPAGSYQIQFKLAGSLRSEVPYTYEVQVGFGNFTQAIGLTWNTPATLRTYNITLTKPSALTFKSLTTMGSYPANAASLWLDDVAVYKIVY